jgi:CheY-like chemotaxis protein
MLRLKSTATKRDESRDRPLTRHTVISDEPYESRMKRRILLVDDDLAVLLTLQAVLELHGFEVETAGSSVEAYARIEAGVYQMVISDLRMETEEAGLDVIRAASQQPYHPATALLTACPPSSEDWSETRGDRRQGTGEGRIATNPDSLFIKPLGTEDLLRQVEALLIRHAERQVDKPLPRYSSGA